MGKKKIDVLLLARPDHSYTIYKGLLKSGLEFVYCSFKLFPRWAGRFIKNPRIRYYDDCYSNCKLLSVLHIYRTTFHKRWMEKYEKPLYEFHLKFLLPCVKPNVIHYWPNFCLNSIRKYKEKHPEVKTYAEVYYPCEHWVLDYIKPVLEQKGIDCKMENVEMHAQHLQEVMKFEKNFLVPSQFVADTYRQYYPDRNYIIIPYGIPRWEGYEKKEPKRDSEHIKRFVYAGQITVQKGCDLLMSYFEQHSEVELNLYGSVATDQTRLFEKYKGIANIIFHGTVPKSHMLKEMSKYDAGIHMSRFDAYSLSVGEMMGAGLPVLVSKNTGNFSQVEEIGAGLGVDLNGEDIAKQIAKMREPNTYNLMVENLDKYLCSEHKSYEEEIIQFYKSNLHE